MLDLLLQQHSWYALFKLHWLLACIFVAVLYIKYILRSPLYTPAKSQIVYFYAAVSFFALLKATPLDVIGKYYLFSAHTLQIFLIYFLVVPLLLLSLPRNFLRQYLWHHNTKLLMKILAHPWLSLVTFNGLITIYYIPSVFSLVHDHLILSVIMHTLLFANAFFMWWVIIRPVPEIKGLNYLMRALYIFLASAILMPTGFFYIIVQHAHFLLSCDRRRIIPSTHIHI